MMMIKVKWNETETVWRLDGEFKIKISAESGRKSGLKDRVCGQIGVTRMPGTEEWIIGPPADN